MQNFDEARAARAAKDRTFQIGGETFTMRAGVRPEALAAYEDLDAGATAADTLGVIDTLIVAFLEPNGDTEERWRSVRAQDDNPVTLADLQELVRWLIAEQTGRPTGPLSASSPGPGSGGTTSTDGSPSPAETSTG